MNVSVKSFHPSNHYRCFQKHALPFGAGPVGFRVWHGFIDEDGELLDENPIMTCRQHLAEAVREKEREGREIAEAMEFEETWLGD